MKNKPKTMIPMSSPDLTDKERQAVLDVLNTPMLSIGPKINEFEAAFSAFSGCSEALGVNAGTSGLHLIVRAFDIGENDLVLTTPFSFVASTNAILFEKGIPVFVDVDPKTGNIDPVLLAQAAADLTAGGEAAKRWLPKKGAENPGPLKAILAVDVFGQPADMDAINQVAKQYNLKVIEDSCEALGAEYKGKKAGTLGDCGIFAFYPNKQITTGEGAMIITNDKKSADMMRALRNQGRAPGDTWLSHTFMGYNYRLDEMSAAMGLVQLERLDEMMEKRDQVAAWYHERLKDLKELELLHIAPETTRHSWFVYVVRTAPYINREQFAASLAELGVPVRPYFVPIHLQPYMVNQFGYVPGDFPITEDLGARGMALPFSSVMTETQVDQVTDAIRQVIANL
jgi:dTDP-4-amino-4,6-dideoxygalactose transaminase